MIPKLVICKAIIPDAFFAQQKVALKWRIEEAGHHADDGCCSAAITACAKGLQWEKASDNGV